MRPLQKYPHSDESLIHHALMEPSICRETSLSAQLLDTQIVNSLEINDTSQKTSVCRPHGDVPRPLPGG